MPTPLGSATNATQGPGQGSVRNSVALLRLIAWLVALGAGVALLHGLGDATLEAPPPTPGAWSSWWSGSDPVVATMALLRLVVLALGWYLLIATLLGLMAHVSRSVTLWRFAELVTARSMRELVAGLVGVALVSATSAPAGATPTLHSNDAGTPVPIQLVLQDDADREGGVSLGVGEVDANGEVAEVDANGQVAERADAGDLSRFRRRGGPLEGSQDLGPDVAEGMVDEPPSAPSDPEADGVPSGPTGGTEQSDTGSTREVPEQADPGPRDDASAGAPLDDATSPTIGSTSEEHVVAAGESFWVIASDLLAEAGQPTDDRTVARYWRVLIEANDDRLVVAGEPDLILPGQRLRVPPFGSVTGTGVAP